MSAGIPTLGQQLYETYLYEYGHQGKEDFAAFVRGAWVAIEASTLAWNWHLDCIADHLMALAAGQITKLAIAVPPRSLKSTLSSVFFPSWVWTFAPQTRFLTGSYSSTLAERDTRRSRQLMQTEWYQRWYGDAFTFRSDQNIKRWYENDQGGNRVATSTDGTGTGLGGDILIVDDPHNVREVHSNIRTDTAIRAAIDWYDKVLSTRRNDVLTSRVMIIGQRVHRDDLIGHVLSQGDWLYLCLPAEYDSTRKFYSTVTSRQTGKKWEDPRIEDGELLHAERLPASFLGEQKAIMGPDYSPQYNQNTASLTSGTIKYHDIRRYELNEDGTEYTLFLAGGGTKMVRVADCRRIVSEDLAVSASDAGCYSVFLLWDISPDYDAILLQCWYDKVEGPDSERMQDTIVEENRERLFGLIMEDVGTLKDAVQRAKRSGYPVIEYKPMRDKEARMNSIAVYFRAGMFFFPKVAAWLATYEMYLCGFPVVKYKDFADATSILLAIYQGLEPNIRIIEEGAIIADQEAAEMEGIAEIRKDNPELAQFLEDDL